MIIITIINFITITIIMIIIIYVIILLYNRPANKPANTCPDLRAYKNRFQRYLVN